jgi:hypothetical protein
LGLYANCMGSAEMLSDGNYFFNAGAHTTTGIQVAPNSGTLTGTQVLNISSPHASYRSWQMPTLYAPPLT